MKTVLTALCLALGLATFAQAEFEYISPTPGSDFHNINSRLVLRPGGELNIDLLIDNPSLLSITGSSSGAHTYDAVICRDDRTINIMPREHYHLDEDVTIDVGAFIESEGVLIDPFSFTFHTSSQLPAKWTAVPEPEEEVSGDREYPEYTIIESNGPAEGNYFINLSSSGGYNAILNSDATVVEWWVQSGLKGNDFKVNRNGNITYYDRQVFDWVEMNEFAEEIAHHDMVNGYMCDNHDFQLLEDGTKFIFAYDVQVYDMSTEVFGGDPMALVEGFVIQELDVDDNLILEWRSWDHLNITDNQYLDLTESDLNPFHINSVEIDTDENVFMSIRHTDELVKYDRITGDVIWRMGMNQQSDFVFADNDFFSYQHDARRLENGNILLYDNANFTDQISRSVEYAIDLDNMQVEVVWQYSHPELLFGPSMGGTNRLPNGNTAIYWGNVGADEWGARVTEVDADGNVVLEFAYELNQASYRVPKAMWFFDESIAGCNDPLAENYNPDAEIPSSYYCVYDLDGDGFTADEDCDDDNEDINPDAEEIPNDGIDQDCDGEDLIISDVDGDGFSVEDGDCNDNDDSINPDADEIPYDGIDQDCDGEDLTDVDGDGFSPDDGDCDDENEDINPDAEEIPNDGIDQDCDGEDLIVGVQELEADINWSYDGIDVRIENANDVETTFTVFDSRGRVVERFISNSSVRISTSNWSTGNYRVICFSGTTKASISIFKD